MRELQTRPCCDAIIKLVFDVECILCCVFLCAQSVCSISVFIVEIAICFVIDEISHLRSELYKELKSLSFPSPSQSCHERHLQVCESSLIFLWQMCCGVYHLHVIDIPDILFPSRLSNVDLSYESADGIEILLACISYGESSSHSSQLFLWDIGIKANVAHHISPIKTYREVASIVAHLCISTSSHHHSHHNQHGVHHHSHLHGHHLLMVSMLLSVL